MTQTTLSKATRVQLMLRGLLAPFVIFGLLFWLAGRLDYWQGWVYFALTIAALVLMSTILTRNASLVEERLNPKEGMKGWDKVYFWITTPLYLIALVLAGLDARLGWSHMPPAVTWIGVAMYVLGQAIFLWARYTNNFFSSVVRIQADRGQTVCKDGPYRFVRHPGYVGGFLFTVTVGLLLGSWPASIPQVIGALMIVWRTAREDRTLQAELPGYADYAREVRFRLVPGLW